MFLPFWNLIGALFAYQMIIMALQSIGLIKSK